MVISPNHKLVRWAYWSPFTKRPERMTLCAFFWQGLVLGTLNNAVVVIVGVLVVPLWLIVNWMDEHDSAPSPDLSLAEQDAWWRRRQARLLRKVARRQRIRESLFVRTLLSIKARACPLVTFSDKEPR